MKFSLRNTSFIYPDCSGNIWVDTKTHIQRAKLVYWVGEYARVGVDHLCLDFAGNDPEWYGLFVEDLMGETKSA